MVQPSRAITSRKVASKARKLLAQPNKTVRTVSGSALTQAADKGTGKKTKK